MYGSRGTLFMNSEKQAHLWKEDGRGSQGGGPDQRLWVVSGASGGPVLDAYETSTGQPKAAGSSDDWASGVSRGYTEEMEHFCWAVRQFEKEGFYPDGVEIPRDKGGLRCNGVVAMADAVTRGGKLYATGTVTQPIIFTMEGDDVNDPNDIPPTVTGQWGGIILMGRAVINSASDVAGNSANPVTDVYEGTTSDGPNSEHRFGGSDDADSSGALRYVSIRHSGRQFALDKELNSLTMGGVGSGTVIEYVESYASSDDAFEWWGGTVNTKHLVAAFCEDDDFDTDQGYRGTNQFWFGIKPPWQGSVDSRGFETDGDTSQTIMGDRQPYSVWRVDNATLIGRGKASTLFGGGRGWNARDEAAPNVFNTAFVDFNTGFLLDADGIYHWTNGPLARAQYNVWDVTTGSANGMAGLGLACPCRTILPSVLSSTRSANTLS